MRSKYRKCEERVTSGGTRETKEGYEREEREERRTIVVSLVPDPPTRNNSYPDGKECQSVAL